MNRNTRTGRTLLCLLTVGCLLFAGTVTASEQEKQLSTKEGCSKVEQQVKSNTRQEEGKKRNTIVKEAVTALSEIKHAVAALEKKNKQEALDALAEVTGKLDIIIAREPALAHAPIDLRVETYDLVTTVDAVKKSVKTARELLGDGEVQQARMLLAGMASEIDFIVTSIPLAVYSDGIKSIAKLVDEEQYEQALTGLYDLLSILVIRKDVMPLPILRAEELLKKAEELAETKDRTEEQNTSLETLLDDTRTQLEMAQALGYGDKKEYREFYRQIKEIKKKTENSHFGKGFMDSLKNSLSSFKAKIFGSAAEEQK